MTTTRRDALGLAATAGTALSLTACGGGDDESSAGSAGPVRVATTDVPSDGGLVQDGVVITQPSEGEFVAFDAECPHQGCAVSEVTSAEIVCPCHGSTFDAGSGEVVTGPATEGLAEKKVTVEGDEVVVS